MVKLLPIFLGGVTVAVLAWLFWVNLVPGGDVTYVQDFKHRNSFISDLWPPEALGHLENGVRLFIKDEVTFFIRPPREFERAQLRVHLVHPVKLKPILSVQTSGDARTWQVIPWQSVLPVAGDTGEVDVATAYQAVFSLNPDWRNPQKRYSIKVLVPGLAATGKSAYMDRMFVRFIGPRVTLGNFWELLRK